MFVSAPPDSTSPMAMKTMLLLLVVSSWVTSSVMAYDHEHAYGPAKAPGHEYYKYHRHHNAPMHPPEAHDHHHREDHHHHEEHYKHRSEEHYKHHPHSPMHPPEAHDHFYNDEHYEHHPHAPMHPPEAHDHHHHYEKHDHHHRKNDQHHDEHYKHHPHAPMHPPEAHDHHHFDDHRRDEDHQHHDDHHRYDEHHRHAYAPRIAPMYSEVKLGAPSPYMAHKHECRFKCKHYCEKDHHKKWPCMKACTACCDKCKCVPEGEKKCMKWDEGVEIKGRMMKCP